MDRRRKSLRFVGKLSARLALGLTVLANSTGCMGPILRQQSPESMLGENSAPSTTLISDVAHPYGLNYVKVEAVSLVTGLAGTGSDPPPTSQRAALLDEMKRRGVEHPNEILASPNTSLVLVRGFLRPGIEAGDHFDIEVRTPSKSETKSLRGGKLLETRLSETAVLDNQIRKGNLIAVANGAVLVDPTAAPDDPAHATQGSVLSGGIATKSRSLGLVLDHERQSVRMSQQIGKAINDRFHAFSKGQQRGLATPKTDEFVELEIHPRYKDNVGRYMRVVRNIAVNESPDQLQSRLLLLRNQLLDPVTAATAAVRLEAIGSQQAIEILRGGVAQDDPEVRFYSAEALAYLDQTTAVDALARAAREEPAFRVHAMAALSAMDDGAAYDALRSLLDVKSAETRYGAFRSLWTMAPNDAFLHGEDMHGQFMYHVLDVGGPPLVHVTSSHRPEVVLFGKEHHLKLPLVLDAGPRILVNGLSGAQVKVSRFGEATEQRIVSTDLDAVIRAVVDLGGTYPDVVQFLQQANQSGALSSRFRVNALPESGREFVKGHSASPDDEPASKLDGDSHDLETPEPELFGKAG